MSNNYIWCLPNGECIKGNKAKLYLDERFLELKMLSNDANEVLTRSVKNNVVIEDGNLMSNVLDLDYSLSIIYIELERLLERMGDIL